MQRWAHGSSSRLGAGLAYYFVFSIAPLLLVAIAVASRVFGEAAIKGEVASQLQTFMGPEGAATVQELLRNATRSSSAPWITGLSTAIILFAASQGVAALRDAPNTIWGVAALPIAVGGGPCGAGAGDAAGAGLRRTVGRLAGADDDPVVAGRLRTDAIDWIVPRAELINTAVSAIVMFLLFAMIFKWLPDVKIGWSDVWAGAAVTPVCFCWAKKCWRSI